MPKKFLVATPVSHLCADKNFQAKVDKVTDLWEVRDNEIELDSKKSTIYHCELNLNLKWNEEEIEHFRKITEKYDLKLVSFHLATRYQENTIVNGAFVGSGKPYTVSEMKGNIRINLATVRKLLGEKTRLLVENNNHNRTDAYKDVTDAGFIKSVVTENNLGFLFDIAHAKITSINTNVPLADYISALPLKECEQVHLCKHAVVENVAFDRHDPLVKEDWDFFQQQTLNLPNLKYVTVEYYKEKDQLLQQLQNVQAIANL